MIREHDIKWFMENPTRLTMMKPFTRGGEMNLHGYEGTDVPNNALIDTGFANLTLHPISQDTYITEYRPDLHHIIINKAIPKVKLAINGTPFQMDEITQTAAFQKLIHSAHTRNLTANPLEFSLLNKTADENETKMFGVLKQELLARDVEWYKYQAINTCKQLGNVGILFSFDKDRGRYDITHYSYEDGYQIVPNYDEYGIEIARSIVYQVEDKLIIDTFDNKNHYRITQNNLGEWEVREERHGFSRCPLLHKRGKVAWEYAESSIEMWEIMANIQAVALKRFGTFALVFIGEMDEGSFKRDSSTLIVNLSSDNTNGKQDAKVLEFPEPQTMDKYLRALEEKISLFSSTSFITPKDITTSNSGGNGIALAMSNDYALATQGALDWHRFINEMVYLHQEGLDLETNGTEHYAQLKIGAKIVPWSLETNDTKVTNLAMEAKWLSRKTIIERSPDAAPDELQRVEKEDAEKLLADTLTEENNDSEKALRMARNRNNLIVDNVATKTIDTTDNNNE